MIISDSIYVVRSYLMNNSSGFLYYSIKSKQFICYTTLKNKYHLIFIMKVNKNVVYGNILVQCQIIKQIFNLYNHNEIPENDFKRECNGCGNKRFGWIIPELTFHRCCNIHDYMYYLGGTKSDRKFADTVFLYNMILNSKKWYHSILARIFYFAVRLFGDKSFNYSISEE